MELLKYLKTFGVRTATDFIKLIDILQFDPYIMAEISKEPLLLGRLHAIHETLGDDEWLSYIRNWRIESSEAARIKVGLVNVPYEIYRFQPVQPGMKQKIAEVALYVKSKDRDLADSLLKTVKALDVDNVKQMMGSTDSKKGESPDASQTVAGQEPKTEGP
jgi:hypothetical protein